MAERTFRLPDLGEGLTEAQLVAWRVREGDQVDDVACLGPGSGHHDEGTACLLVGSLPPGVDDPDGG